MRVLIFSKRKIIIIIIFYFKGFQLFTSFLCFVRFSLATIIYKSERLNVISQSRIVICASSLKVSNFPSIYPFWNINIWISTFDDLIGCAHVSCSRENTADDTRISSRAAIYVTWVSCQYDCAAAAAAAIEIECLPRSFHVYKFAEYWCGGVYMREAKSEREQPKSIHPRAGNLHTDALCWFPWIITTSRVCVAQPATGHINHMWVLASVEAQLARLIYYLHQRERVRES